MNISLILFILIIFIFLTFIKSQISYETLSKNLILYINCNRGIKDEGIFNIPIYSSGVEYQKDFKNIELNSCFFNSTKESLILSDLNIFSELKNFFLSFYFKAYEINNTTELPIISLLSLENELDYDVISFFNTSIYFYFSLENYTVLNISDFSIDKWYYIGIKLIDKTVNFYINGESRINITLDYSYNIKSKTFDFMFIGANLIKDSYFYGNIDEISIMNLSEFSISDEQINAFYHKNVYCDEGGYYYNLSLKSCEPCCDRHCINCVEGSYCLVCHDKFYLNDKMDTCICQKENCIQCDDNGVCVECVSGFSLNEDSICVLNNCDEFPFCSSCSLDRCITCINKYKLNKNGDCKLPYKTITSLIICYIILVIFVWIVVFVFAKPKFFKIINK